MKKLTNLWIKTIALLSLFLSFVFTNTLRFILSVLNPKQTAANNPAFDIYLLNAIPFLRSPQARSSGKTLSEVKVPSLSNFFQTQQFN